MEDDDNIVYLLTVEDIQTVATEEIDRELTDDEIQQVKETIGEKIDWYAVIANTISEKIGNSTPESSWQNESI